MPNAEAEYVKLKGLLETLSRVCEQKDKLLDGAETALKGNIGNLDALSNLESNLHNTRRNLVTELEGIIKNFGK